MLLVLLSAGLLALSSAQRIDKDAEKPSYRQYLKPQGPPPNDQKQDDGPQQRSFPPGDNQYNPPPKNQQEPAQSGGPNRKDLPPPPGNYQGPPPVLERVSRVHSIIKPSDAESNDRKQVGC